MGCSQSKIENEEAVSRCKDRKTFMKSAVVSRNAFAAAHSSYAMSLKNAGAALSGFAHGESLISYSPISSASPLSDAAAGAAALPAQPPPPLIQTIRPPPPLPELTSDPRPPQLQRAATMPEFAVSDSKPAPGETIEEEDEDEDGAATAEDEEEAEEEEEEELNYRRRRRGGKGGSVGGRIEHNHVVEDVPPPSEAERHARKSVIGGGGVVPPPPMPESDATWDYFFNVDNMTGGSLQDVEEMRREAEERRVYEGMPKRTAYRMVAPAPASTTVVMEGGAVDMEMEMERPPLPPGGGRMLRKGKAVAGASANGGGGNGEGKRRGVSMVQVFSELDDCFLKAYESAHDVSKMLEATRLHYHSNFADSRGHIDHSARVMRVITWNRSFRGLPNAEEFKDDTDTEESETHASVLDKLLAWEKKLYDEVKAGELMKYEYQRKVALLNKQKKRGTHSESLEKTKAAVSHLHTRYIVDMQSMDSTVSEINRLRDEQLYPKLVALVDGMAIMWDVMRGLHEKQLKLATALKYVDISQSVKETTEQHHIQTEQLWAVFQEWQTQFDRMVTQQKEYIRALNSWLKLNLVPIESSLKEKVSSPPRVQKPPIQDLLLAWHDLLEKLPDEHAKSAICNFAAVLETISQQQGEELRFKVKMEESRRDLEKKQRQFNRWRNEYLQKKMPADETDPTFEDGVHKDEIMVDKEFVMENAKKKLEEDTEFWQRQCVHVREKSLASFKTRLPELFRALSDFALASSEMYSNLRDISRSQGHRH